MQGFTRLGKGLEELELEKRISDDGRDYRYESVIRLDNRISSKASTKTQSNETAQRKKDASLVEREHNTQEFSR